MYGRCFVWKWVVPLPAIWVVKYEILMNIMQNYANTHSEGNPCHAVSLPKSMRILMSERNVVVFRHRVAVLFHVQITSDVPKFHVFMHGCNMERAVKFHVGFPIVWTHTFNLFSQFQTLECKDAMHTPMAHANAYCKIIPSFHVWEIWDPRISQDNRTI